MESEQGKDILIVLIVILVGVGSFELGRLSKSGQSGGIKIEYSGDVPKLDANVVSAVGNPPERPVSSGRAGFFASSRGKKYYPVGCTAGASLKEENKIWFDTREVAEAAGYELSSSCQ